MNRVFVFVAALGMVAATIPEANAAACAAGVYRAGCVGPHGTVVTTRPVVHPAPVYRHPACFWRAGVRVCR